MKYSLVRKLCLLATGLILVTAIPASAARRSRPSYFDGQRKGLVMGIGLGYVPVVWSGPRYCGEVESGIDFDLLAGYGWSEANVITIELSLVFYKENHCPFTFELDYEGLESDVPFAGQMFLGSFWYHYFGHPKRPFFTLLGVGLHGADRFRSGHDTFGLSFGGGWQMARHFHLLIRYAGNNLVNLRRESATGHLSVLLRVITY